MTQQEVVRLMQRFVRRYLSSGATVTEVQYRRLSNTWVGYVRMEAGMEAKLVAVQRGDMWDIKIRDTLTRPDFPPAPSGARQPAEATKVLSIRWKLDRSYVEGIISYEDYCRRLRLIGQR